MCVKTLAWIWSLYTERNLSWLDLFNIFFLNLVHRINCCMQYNYLLLFNFRVENEIIKWNLYALNHKKARKRSKTKNQNLRYWTLHILHSWNCPKCLMAYFFFYSLNGSLYIYIITCFVDKVIYQCCQNYCLN